MSRFSLPLAGLTLLALSLSPPTTAAHAAPFEVVPGAIQLVEFESDAPIENIRGLSTEAKGQIALDPSNPNATTGRITVPVASLRTGNTTRDGHLQQPEWLDAKAHPDLVFALESVALDLTGPLALGATATGKVTGTFTIKGKTKRVTVPVKVAYLAASDKLKKVYIEGNALRIKGELTLRLADFGVVPPDHLAGVKVADQVSIRFALTAVEK